VSHNEQEEGDVVLGLVVLGTIAAGAIWAVSKLFGVGEKEVVWSDPGLNPYTLPGPGDPTKPKPKPPVIDEN